MMCSRNAYCAKDDDEGAAVDGIFAPLVCCSNDNIREALRRPVELDVAPPDGMFLVTVPPDARPGQTIRTQAALGISHSRWTSTSTCLSAMSSLRMRSRSSPGSVTSYTRASLEAIW